MANNGLNIDDLQIQIVVEVEKAVSSLNKMSSAAKRAAEGVTSSFRQMVNKAVSSANKMTSVLSQTTEQVEEFDNTIKDLADDTEESSVVFEKAAKTGLGKFFAQIKRIATYRAIRSALMFLTEATKEGFNMFVTWDREQNNYMAGTARNVDKLSEKWTMLKGQIGALGGALANAVVPIITWVVEGLTKMVDLLQMVIRSLQGEYSYYKLIYHEAKATTGQAKELKRILFGFDELNVLPSANGGGGGVSGGNWAYEELPINSNFLNGIADLSNKIKEFLGLSKDGQNIIGGLVGVVGSLIGVKALGGLLGLLPRLISGFKQKNTSLADQTSKVTADATATQGLATKLGLALGAATLFSTFLKNNPLNVQVNKPQVDFSAFEGAISQAKQYAANNPINIQLGATADLTGFAKIATFIATNPVSMAISLPIAAVLTAAQSLRNTVQSWFNSNPWRIPVAVGKGAAQGKSSLATGLSASAISGASAISRGSTVADVEKQIRDSMLNYESDLWHQGGTLGKVVGTFGGAALASVTTGGLLTGGVLSGGVLAELLGLLGLAGSFASGGTIPNTGSLFYAGEAGAEVVANIGHSTGVMNMSQMQDAVANGNIEVVNAVYAMANMVAGAVNNKNFDVYMDSAKVGQSVSRYQYNQARRGVPQGAI